MKFTTEIYKGGKVSRNSDDVDLQGTQMTLIEFDEGIPVGRFALIKICDDHVHFCVICVPFAL